MKSDLLSWNNVSLLMSMNYIYLNIKYWLYQSVSPGGPRERRFMIRYIDDKMKQLLLDWYVALQKEDFDYCVMRIK